jgi:hypothetical protein
MTILEFRQIPEFTSRMREILSDPVFVRAIAILQGGGMPTEDPLGGNELASVRQLNQCIGVNSAVTSLFTLAEPFIPDKNQLGAPKWEPEEQE